MQTEIIATSARNTKPSKLPEYWIVDPIVKQITVLTLVSGLYEEAVFAGDDAIASAMLSELGQESPLTARQVLQVGTSK